MGEGESVPTSLPKNPKEKGQDNADEDGGGQRKVEGEILFFDDDISRKSANPWYLLSDQ
jgi:hypothetical protein